MKNSVSKRVFAITSSLIAGMLLSLLPLPQWALWYRPLWVFMIFSYWVLALPHRIGLGMAFVLGLLMDSLQGTLIGVHTIALLMTTFLLQKFYLRLRLFPLMQQASCIFVLSLLYQALIFMSQHVVAKLPFDWRYWMASLTTMLLWPWLFVLLRDWRRRFEVV